MLFPQLSVNAETSHGIKANLDANHARNPPLNAITTNEDVQNEIEPKAIDLDHVKQYDLTIVIPVSRWEEGPLRSTIQSVANYIECSPLEVDCLIVEIIPEDVDIQLLMFKEIHALPEFISEVLSTRYFRYLAEYGYTARALRKILLNCRGRRALILGEGMRIGISAARSLETGNSLATVFPAVSHKASIRHWSKLRDISERLPGISSFSIVSLVGASQVSFDKEKIIQSLKVLDPFEADFNLFERILKQCLVISLLSCSSFVEVGTSTAISHEICFDKEGEPISMEMLREKLYGSQVKASIDVKISADFAIDYTLKAFRCEEDIDWEYPAKHFGVNPLSLEVNLFSLVIRSISLIFRCSRDEISSTTTLLQGTINILDSFSAKKSQPDPRIMISIISSVFREKELIGGFLSNILRLEQFDEDHELILVLPERDASQGIIIDLFFLLHPQIRVLQMNEDPGIYACWNLAIEMARGAFITNANCDDRRFPLHTREIVRALDVYNADIGSAAILVADSIDFLVSTDYGCTIEQLESYTCWFRHGDNHLIEEKGLDDFFLYDERGEVVQCYNFPHCMPVWRKRIHAELGFFDEKLNGTYGDFALWLKAAKAGKKFIHFSKVLGVYLFRNSSHNRKNSDLAQWMQITRDALPGKIINSVSKHVDVSFPKRCAVLSQEMALSLDFGCQISQNYGSHRAGWSWVVSHLQGFHDRNSSVYCDLFLEKKFVWGNDEGDAWHVSAKPFDKEWIGFLHVPPHVPSFFQYEQSNQQVFRTTLFKHSFELCRALIALTNYHAEFLREVFKNTHVKIYSLHHPTEVPGELSWFSLDRFNEAASKKIVQVGWWLRKLNAINCLASNYSNIKPAMLGGCDWNKSLISYSERRYYGLTGAADVEFIPFLGDTEYDDLISSSLVFVDFYDTSANNAIIECIARRSPVLVPRHPAIHEYLGSDYPLYFNSLSEVAELIGDPERIRAAHCYLGQEWIQRSIKVETFLASFRDIVRSVSGAAP